MKETVSNGTELQQNTNRCETFEMENCSNGWVIDDIVQ